MDDLQQTVDAAWESRANLSPAGAPAAVRDAVARIIDDLDAGRLRVAEKRDGAWTTHQWIKKAVLLSFRLADNMPSGLAGPHVPFRFYDQAPDEVPQFGEAAVEKAGVRSARAARAR